MKRYSNITGIIVAAICAAFFLQSCNDNGFNVDFSASPPPYDTTAAVADTTLPGNLQIYTIRRGKGDLRVTPEDQIRVRFTTRLKNGKIVDGTYINKKFPRQTRVIPNLTPNAFTNSLGSPVQPAIEGLRKGVIGMKEGEKRTIVIPPDMGNIRRSRNRFGFSVRGKTLIYDIELVHIL